jgi:hypothetical protein
MLTFNSLNVVGLSNTTSHGFDLISNDSEFLELKYFPEYSDLGLVNFQEYDNFLYTCGYDYYNVSLVKIDLDGNLVWERIWEFYSYSNHIWVNEDGVYIGGSILLPEDSSDNYLAKYHHNGTLSWNITWDYGWYDRINDLVVTPTSIYVTSYFLDINRTDNVYISEFDLDGNLLWEKFLGNSEILFPERIEINIDGIYVGGQYEKEITNKDEDIFLMKFSFNGDLIWNITWGGYDDEYIYDMKIFNEKIYVTAYYVNSSKFDNAIILCFNLKGNYLWSSNWSYETEIEIPRQSNFGTCTSKEMKIFKSDIYILGDFYYHSKEMDDFIYVSYILKYDQDGNLIWDKCLDPDLSLRIFDMKINDKGIILTGWTAYYHPDFSEITPYILITTLNGDGLLDLNVMPYVLVNGEDINGYIHYRVEVGVTLTINVSNSTDLDGYITGYYFDFGDGNNSGWINDSIITYKYDKTSRIPIPGGTSIYNENNFTVRIIDNEGTISERTIFVYVFEGHPDDEKYNNYLSFSWLFSGLFYICPVILVILLIIVILGWYLTIRKLSKD